MKLIKSEDLSINDNTKIVEKYIGSLKSKVIIAENFFNNPDFVREYALEASYVDEKAEENLGSPETDNTHWYTHRTALNGAHYKQFFSWAKQELYEDGNWQNDVFPPQFSFQMYDRIGECVPHVDSSNYAGLVPLNTEEELKESFSGTGFYKYNKNDSEMFSSQSYRHWEISNSRYQDFTRYHTEYHRYNTLIMYEAKLLHNAEAKWKSDTKRLTFNFFTW